MLAIKNLSFGWLDEPLFENITCTLEKGQIVLLKGENGSGKTTLLQLISGMIPHFSRGKILKGNIFFAGRSVLSEPPKLFFPNIALIPSKHIDFFLLNESLSEEILLTRAVMKLSKKCINDKLQQFKSIFTDFHIFENLPFKHMLPYQKILSLLVIYYLQGANFYLFDEVLNTYSSNNDHNNWFNFFEWQAQQNCSIVFVSHQIEQTKFSIWEIKNKKLIC